ncbi:MAG: hypothetical protein N0E48_20690 [Candidatus Thiodiazotropha endolucinida]|nr:hypothetical protein [Candidatus Thiodiazotropha endolucinida]
MKSINEKMKKLQHRIVRSCAGIQYWSNHHLLTDCETEVKELTVLIEKEFIPNVSQVDVLIRTIADIEAENKHLKSMLAEKTRIIADLSFDDVDMDNPQPDEKLPQVDQSKAGKDNSDHTADTQASPKVPRVDQTKAGKDNSEHTADTHASPKVPQVNQSKAGKDNSYHTADTQALP